MEDLKAGRVTQREQFKYFLALALFGAVVMEFLLYSGGYSNDLEYPDDAHWFVRASMPWFLSLGISVVITIIGVRVCYKINGAGDDEDFILRMTCLSVPVLVRVIVLFLLFCIPVVVMAAVSYHIVSTDISAVLETESMADIEERLENDIRALNITLVMLKIFELLAGIAVSIIMWVYLAAKIRKVSAR